MIKLRISSTAYEQVDSDWLPGLCPYLYQWEAYQHVKRALERNETLCLFLVTPTGSGKTLASYAYSIKAEIPAIGAYPTNELIRDQERALKPWIDPKEEYKLLRVDSAQLDHWEARLDLDRHSETLETLLRWEPTLLTNPDILFYVFFGLYQGLPGVSQRLFALVSDVYRLFVFDEFHLYNVKQMADVAFLVGALRRINPSRGRVFIFASATPQWQMIHWLRDKIGLQVEVIEGAPSKDPSAHLISHHLELTIVPADLAHWKGPEALVEALKIIDQFLKVYPEGRLVTILDGVAGAINVAQIFQERYPDRAIGEVHGLCSEKVRIEALRQQITVGTSTIEVGIDFKDEMEKDFLIFEARTDSQFIQRLGRIARHEKKLSIPDHALALVPPYVYHFLKERLGSVNDRSLERQELYKLIEEAYQPPEDFSMYLTKHAPVEFHAASRFIRTLFQPDDKSHVVTKLDRLIETLTRRTGRAAAGQYQNYKEREIIAPLMTFRGADFEAAILDERDRDPGFPVKRYSLMFLLRRGLLKVLDESGYLRCLEELEKAHPEWIEELEREKRYARRIGRKPTDLLGVYGHFRLKKLLGEPRRVWFEVARNDIRRRKGKVTSISGLEIMTDPFLPPQILNPLNRFLRRKRIVAWFIDKHPATIRLGRSLPPLFAIYELRIRLPGGRLSDAIWSIAFNQDAFFLDSLGWMTHEIEDEAFIV